MNIGHFYHLAADFDWPGPLTEHRNAIYNAKVPGEVTVNVTGSDAARLRAVAWLAERWPEAKITTRDGRYEDVTLALALDWAHDNPAGMVLYAHAKGSYNPGPFADAWRQSMTIDVVDGWQRCTDALESGWFDVVGPFWLDPVVIPNMRVASQQNGGSSTPYFGGNFWWARAGYLASLPVPGHRTRWDAERWIGLGAPRACNLRPGWPNMMLFAGPLAERLLAGLPEV